MASEQNVENLIDLAIKVSTRKMQYFECCKKKSGFRYFKKNPHILKNTIANMDNSVFLTPLDHSKTLQADEIKLDENKIANAFKMELKKSYPDSYKQIFQF